MFRTPSQHQVLHHELDIYDATVVMLDVENVILPGCGCPEVAAHFLTHIDHLLPKRRLVPLSAQYLVANILERFERIVAACHSPGAGQRLMLPGPGILLLVFLERLQGTHQQAGVTRGAQSHIHFVELPGGCLGTENVHDSLAEPGIEHGVINRLVAIGGQLRISLVHKHQIQI